MSERLLDIYFRTLSIICLRILPKVAWAKKRNVLAYLTGKSRWVFFLSWWVGAPAIVIITLSLGSLFPFFIFKGSSHMIAKVTNDSRLSFYPVQCPQQKRNYYFLNSSIWNSRNESTCSYLKQYLWLGAWDVVTVQVWVMCPPVNFRGIGLSRQGHCHWDHMDWNAKGAAHYQKEE